MPRILSTIVCLMLGVAPSVCVAEDPPKVATTLRVGASQFRSSRDLHDNVARISDQIKRAGEQGLRVLVFPECALTSYDANRALGTTSEQYAGAERAIGEACRAAGVYAIVGSPYREGDKVYNSAIVFDPSGRVLERYHKIQLAESWPAPGDHMSVFPVDGVPCSIIVCHDERYPELVRLPVLAGARVVFYVSHESGLRFERKIDPYRAQIQARAVENNVYIVQSNAPANNDLSGSHGQSRVIAPDGTILKEASQFDEEVVSAALDLRQATGANASKSLSRGPLQDWWREGIERVRIIPALPPK